MSAPTVTPLKLRKGIVKQVVSGDTIVIRAKPVNGPPPEKTIVLSCITAPKLARRPTGTDETKDEPWAWEAREFLRQKLIGKEVYFSCDRPANSTREYGFIFMGPDPDKDENVVESIVSEGLVTVRRDASRTHEEIGKRLLDLEEQAKSAGRGRFGSSPSSEHVRNIKWTQENPRSLVDSYDGRLVKAIIEHVRDGSTIRAFLLPDFHYITLMISGIRCPGVKLDADGRPDPSVVVPFADEARYFVESNLLQRDVEIRLESVNNSNFVGSILYPKGNIAEALLRLGLAKCVDWSMAFMKIGADKLRQAEREAKEKRLRLWKDYQSNTQQFSGKEKDFTGTVVEVFNGDAINVKMPNGQVKKVFLSSIRPPRDPNQRVADDDTEKPQRNKNARPLFDIPWMFEAREFLRKRLIGKKVHCILDYISPAREQFPEKYCYTVLIGDQNVAEGLVSKGFATVIRYRQDDDQRSSRYDDLLCAEAQAIKGQKGMHSKKEYPPHRINDLTTEYSRIKHQYLPSWQRASRTEAVVEFVASGSRLRLYIPKDSCIVTFLLGGISCPRSSRPALNGAPAKEAEPFGDEALAFTKDRILQRDVSVHIETTDKMGTAVIGWLWTDNNINLSVALVEEGLAEVHFSAEKSEHYRALKNAEDKAKSAKKGIWSTYVEEEVQEKIEEEKEEKVVERKVNYISVVVTEITSDLSFYAQHTDEADKLDKLMAKLKLEFKSNPPITGAYTPRRGDLCAAQFSIDGEWYRAKVEKVQNRATNIFYVDYGNKETVSFERLAHLPPAFANEKPFAHEYSLALVNLPPDNEDKEEALRAFATDTLNRKLLLNIEYYKSATAPVATLYDPENNNADIGKNLVKDGVLLSEKRRDRKLKDLINAYKEAQEQAKKSRLGIWQYGDITEDDAVEFGR